MFNAFAVAWHNTASVPRTGFSRSYVAGFSLSTALKAVARFFVQGHDLHAFGCTPGA